MRYFERHGAIAKVSSIHVNGWYGDYDKLSMAKVALRDLFGLDWESARDAVIYVGDSPNDEPMFAAFPLERRRCEHPRTSRTASKANPPSSLPGHSGDGFVELAARLLIPARPHDEFRVSDVTR